MNQESDLRKEIERRFSILIDDKFNALKIEISKESKNRYECIENLKIYCFKFLFCTIILFIFIKKYKFLIKYIKTKKSIIYYKKICQH